MTDRTVEDQMFIGFLDNVARLRGLSERQSEEAEELERAIRSSLNQAIADERNVKSQVGQIRKDTEALLGRTGRLAARAGVADLQGEQSTSRMPTRLNEFPNAITALEQDVKGAESSWDWVERSASSTRRMAEASTAQVRPSPSVLPEAGSTADAKSTRARRLRLVLPLVAMILIVVVVIAVLL